MVKRERVRFIFKKPVLLTFIILSTAVWIILQNDFILGLFSRNPYLQPYNTTGFLVNTEGCRIQNLENENPIDAQEWFLDEELHFNCKKNGKRDPVRSTWDSLFVDGEALKDYSLDGQAVCCYRELFKKDEGNYNLARICVPFHGKVKIKYEFVRVSCSGLKDDVLIEFYRDWFAFVQPSRYYRHGNSQIPPSNGDRLNVLILGLDAMSRLNFYRQLPSVVDFLKAHDYVELLGYNKVGENTFPNLIPFLTGLTVDQLVKACWETTDTVFDDCYFLWNHYKDSGYITGFGEDSVEIGLFNYFKAGFYKNPTDFYSHPYHETAESELGHELLLNCKLCVGQRPSFQLVLNDAFSFAMNLKNNSNFGFFWINSISHDFLNLPSYADWPILSFLQQLKENGVLNTTVFIMMSDHGIRWGPIRHSYRGFIEARLPGMFLLFPKWFQDKYGYAYANIRENRRRLTTPFDLHETLFDLSDLSRISDYSIGERSRSRTLTRGRSLFLSTPLNRTCESAGISPRWCACYNTKSISISQPIVAKLAEHVVNFTNDLLAGFPQCSRLQLLKVQEARVESLLLDSDDWSNTNPTEKDFVITVQTQPGLGLFEATVRQLSGYRLFAVIPPVSRINVYGSQSSCVSNYNLKPYCYCTNTSK